MYFTSLLLLLPLRLPLRRQLLDDIIRIFPRQRHVLCVTPPCEHFTLTIGEIDRREGEGLADCRMRRQRLNRRFETWDGDDCWAPGEMGSGQWGLRVGKGEADIYRMILPL